MKRRKLCLLILAAFLALRLTAQTAVLSPLTPGAVVPDLKLENLLHYKKGTVRLSEFRGKLLLLDLWTTACPGCLKSFPVLEAMQQQFEGRVVVLPISFGAPASAVQRFLEKRRKSGHPIGLPTAVVPTYDHALLELFPAEGFPHLVWIDGQGRFVAVTSSLELSAENIRRVLAGERPNFASEVKRTGFSSRRPLLVDGNGGPDSAFRYRSLITPFISGLPVGGLTAPKGEAYTRIFVSNAPVADLVRTAVYRGRLQDVFNKQLLLEVSRPEHYRMPPEDSLFYRRLDSFAWCYELILPRTYSLQEAYAFMLQDVCRYFHLTAGFEKRPQRCWVLRHDPAKGSPRTKGGREQYLSGKDEWWFSVRNRPLSLLRGFVDKRDYPLVVDATDLKGNIDMDIRLPEQATLSDWQKALARYGLTLSEEEYLVDLLVIREQK